MVLQLLDVGQPLGRRLPGTALQPDSRHQRAVRILRVCLASGSICKDAAGAPPLAGFQMPSSQFTFSVGSSATMHVAGDAVASSSGRSTPNGNTSRRGQSSRDQHGGGGSLAIGRHTISSPRSSRATSPHASSSRSRGGGASSDERLVLLDQAKAIECKGGGFLTRKEKDQGKKPLPEHLFLQWLRDRQAHSEFANKIRKRSRSGPSSRPPVKTQVTFQPRSRSSRRPNSGKRLGKRLGSQSRFGTTEQEEERLVERTPSTSIATAATGTISAAIRIQTLTQVAGRKEAQGRRQEQSQRDQDPLAGAYRMGSQRRCWQQQRWGPRK